MSFWMSPLTSLGAFCRALAPTASRSLSCCSLKGLKPFNAACALVMSAQKALFPLPPPPQAATPTTSSTATITARIDFMVLLAKAGCAKLLGGGDRLPKLAARDDGAVHLVGAV